MSIAAAEIFVRIANNSVSTSGQFTVALAGGSTPRLLYKLLATDKFRTRIDWKRVFFFFGDERNVPPDFEQSNFRMAYETLFAPLKTSESNIFRWHTEFGEPEEIASDYADRLGAFFGRTPRFDLTLLGLGSDGHTASLFPGTDAVNETAKMAIANWVEKLGEYRLTLTFPVINNSANVVFLVSGEEKAVVLKSVLEGELGPEPLPAQLVNPVNGELFWMVDEDAAGLLTSR